MQDSQLARISNFIWNLTDDVLRDIYQRGKYRDVILPMTVLRRLDAVLEPTKAAVLDCKRMLDGAGITEQAGPLQDAAGQAFYNTGPFTLRDLRDRSTAQRLGADFEDYLDGFSANVQDILNNFQFRHQIGRLSDADALGTLIDRFLDPGINWSPEPARGADGVMLPGLDNHAMGSIFEELVRRFNEENNEEAGEHWTPRDAVQLMAQLVFEPVADRIASTTYTLYDGAMGTGGMLTVADNRLHELARGRGKQVSTHLYGQEINAETYAICKADLLLSGEGGAADNVVGGPEHSTLSSDAFGGSTFDFMLSNPPYGKSWKSDYDKMGGKAGVKDPRFVISHAGDPEYSLLTRTSDGQLLFLVNNLSKMKRDTPLGSRIAEVHNGSSLFAGDAGQGESNIRRWIIENDWLEAIVALPLNLFYNTGIATYIWALSNRKAAHRQGYVQLIDATEWYSLMPRNLGKKTRELSDADLRRICDTFLDFDETEHSRILPNDAFGYWRVSVERPLRLPGIDPERAYAPAEIRRLKADADAAASADGRPADAAVDTHPVIRRIHGSDTPLDALAGRFAAVIKGQPAIVEYEPDPDLRDTEQIPLRYAGGIAGFLQRETLPYAPDAWHNAATVKIGYEINFNRYFYRTPPARPLADIRAELAALERDAAGALDGGLA